MTQLPEVVLAAEAGQCYAAIAMVTDYDCWKEDESEHCDIAMIQEIMKINSQNVQKVLKEVIGSIKGVGWIEESKEIRHKIANSNFLGR